MCCVYNYLKINKLIRILANGTNRSESCVVILLQKSTEAKRSYGTLLNATSLFGETDTFLLQHSEKMLKEVLLNAYKEAGVDPAKVAYVEGEGIGIKVYLSNLC